MRQVIIPFTDKPKPGTKKYNEHQSAKIGQLKSQGTHAYFIGESGQADHHKGTVSRGRIGHRRNKATELTVGQKALIHPLAQLPFGQNSHTDSQTYVNEYGRPRINAITQNASPFDYLFSCHPRKMINMLTIATITHSTQNKKLAISVGMSFRILNGIMKSSTKRNTNQLTQPQNDLPIFFFLSFV